MRNVITPLCYFILAQKDRDQLISKNFKQLITSQLLSAPVLLSVQTF